MMHHNNTKLHVVIRTTWVTAFVAVVLLGVPIAARAEVSVEVSPSFGYVVIDGGGGGYEAFPDVTRLDDGRLMCIFYEGYAHISPPKAGYPTGGKVMYVTSSNEGYSWSAPAVLHDSPLDDRDPSITQLSDGRLMTTYFTYDNGVSCSYVIESDDAGLTWSTPQQLAYPSYGVSTPIRELSTGRLVAPLYYEDGQSAHGAIVYSDNGGASWSAPVAIPDSSGTYLDAETDVIELKNGNLYAAQRSSHNPARCSVSTDQGETWSDSEDMGFIAHCPYLFRPAVNDDVILMGYRYYEWPAGTGHTALRYSTDECETWSEPITIDANCIGAYPSFVDLADGTVLVTYYEEGGGSNIRSRIITVTPEPATMLLVSAGLVALVRRKRSVAHAG
ncbi:MAG: exo-alpha-sialidase [Phycisphaerae bacterium]|nr:exo-alpha-sialidase [Phycisphaerae bacterium]